MANKKSAKDIAFEKERNRLKKQITERMDRKIIAIYGLVWIWNETNFGSRQSKSRMSTNVQWIIQYL